MKPTILLISYHWPPSGSVATLRPVHIARYLAKYGWRLIVVVPSGADYPNPTQDDLDLSGIEIWRVPIREPYRFYRFLTGSKHQANVQDVLMTDRPGWSHRFAVWCRANLFVPDARSPWIGKVVDTVRKKVITGNDIRAIVTSGPPHTNHMIGLRLKELLQLPWVADFQDPWTEIEYFTRLPLNGRAYRLHIELEKLVFTKADQVTAVSPSWANRFSERFQRPVHCVYLGFDENEYKPCDVTQVSPSTLFGHFGTLSQSRCPDNFLLALKLWFEKNYDKAKPGLVHFCGDGNIVLDKFSGRGLGFLLKVTKAQERRKALEMMKECRFLLLLGNNGRNQKGRIPAKLFEYLRSGRPILYCGDPSSDVADIIRSTNSGIVTDATSIEGIQRSIDELFSRGSELRTKNLASLSTGEQMKRFASVIENAIGDSQRFPSEAQSVWGFGAGLGMESLVFQ